MQFSKLGNHSGTVGGIRNAEPTGISIKHLHRGLA